MNIRLISLLTFLVCNFVNGQIDSEEKKYSGFEIYFIKEFKGSERSYWDFNKKEQRQFKREYKKNAQIPDSICHWYINLDKSQINEKPFLNQTDIEYYSPNSYQIKLTESGIKKISQLKSDGIPVSGKPFIIVANGKKLIGAWFWSLYSSSLCDRVFSQIDGKSEKIHLSFLYCGNDPRNGIFFLNELTEIN